MPCFSRVTKTQMDNLDRLIAAAEAMGHTVVGQAQAHRVSFSNGMTFSRVGGKGAFQMTGADESEMAPIGRKYGELSVRSWAKKRNFSVLGKDETTMTLVNRRGGTK